MSEIFTFESIIFYVASLLFWPSCYHVVSLYNGKPELVKNFVHLLHAFLFVSLYKCLDHNIINYPIILSLGFYTVDLSFIFHSLLVKHEKCSRHLPYIIHHIIANYGLLLALTEYYREQIMYFYYILEYSNFLLYLNYHIRRDYSNYKNLLLVIECFQFIWYTYFRIIRFLIYWYHIRNDFFDTYFPVQCMTIVLFGMGAFWSFNLFKKCLKSLKIESNIVAEEDVVDEKVD